MHLRDLQNSYLNSLKAITSSSKQRKLAEAKKDDELKAARDRDKYSFDREKKTARELFPLNINMFLASCLLWFGISILIYYTISYGRLYVRVIQEEDLDTDCKVKFTKDKELNLKKIENYTAGDAIPYLARLKFRSDQPDFPMESNNLPPVVTAVTTDHFNHVQGLIRHLKEDIQPTQTDLKLIIFDMGLSKKQREIMTKYCHCEIRDLDYDSFPVHVASYYNFAWRPVILQQMLLEYGAVVYIDPTTRFKNPSALNSLRMRGSRSYFLWDYLTFTPMIAFTEVEMFDYFKEQRCTFQECSLLTSEAIVLYQTAETWNTVMKPWLKCAFNLGCISPPNALYSGCFEIRRPRTTGCHRFDMSALSVILNRGQQYTIGTENMVSFRLTYTLHQEEEYFPEQPWTYKQILMISAIPVIILLVYKYKSNRRNRFIFC